MSQQKPIIKIKPKVAVSEVAMQSEVKQEAKSEPSPPKKFTIKVSPKVEEQPPVKKPVENPEDSKPNVIAAAEQEATKMDYKDLIECTFPKEMPVFASGKCTSKLIHQGGAATDLALNMLAARAFGPGTHEDEEDEEDEDEDEDEDTNNTETKHDQEQGSPKLAEMVLAFRVECHSDFTKILTSASESSSMGYIGGYTCQQATLNGLAQKIPIPDYDVSNFRLRVWVKPTENPTEIMTSVLKDFIAFLAYESNLHVAHESLDLQSRYTGERSCALEESLSEHASEFVEAHMSLIC